MVEISGVNKESLFSMGKRSKKQGGLSGVIRETKRTQQERRKAEKLERAKKKPREESEGWRKRKLRMECDGEI